MNTDEKTVRNMDLSMSIRVHPWPKTVFWSCGDLAICEDMFWLIAEY
jgi:hypothetical protein